MKNGTKKIAVGAAIAAAAGYVAGILTAPKSGRETREDIKDAAGKAKAEAERKLKALHSELDDLINRGKKTASKLQDKSKGELVKVLATAQTAKQKARDMLSALHEGGAEDKDLQKAIDEVNQAVKHLKAYLTKNEQKAEPRK